jgi:hypothetical protein
MNIHTQPEKTSIQQNAVKRQAESGQAIVVMTFMMISLLGMLGLAIDGGGMYFMWRDVRNATDAAVMAASYAKCTGGNIVTAGLNAAAANGFDNNGTTNTVQIHNPPTSGDAMGDDDFVEVIINANRSPYFIHLVYKGPLEVTNRAVGYCVPAFDPSDVPGLWAGSSVCNNTINWQGSDAWITGGIFSNNEIEISQGIVEDTVEAVNTVGDLSRVTWDPGQPSWGHPAQPDPMNLNISLYESGGEVSQNIVDLGGYYTSVGPGSPNYNNGVWRPHGQELRGLYFVTGDADLGTGNSYHAEGATIVATGQIDFNAGNAANIKYYDLIMSPTPSGVQYPGILFYSSMNNPCDVSNTNAIIMRGSSFTSRGILYAPRSNVNVSGSNFTMWGSVIADMINYSGSNSSLHYDPSILPPRPPRINVAE